MFDATTILSALQQQLACYQRLAKLAEVQREHVQSGDAEALLAVLARRHEVLEDLARLESAIAPARRQWGAFVSTLAGETRRQIESVMSAVRALLEQITRSDKDDVMLLQQRKLNVGKQINQAAASRSVNRAYASATYSRPAANMDVSR